MRNPPIRYLYTGAHAVGREGLTQAKIRAMQNMAEEAGGVLGDRKVYSRRELHLFKVFSDENLSRVDIIAPKPTAAEELEDDSGSTIDCKNYIKFPVHHFSKKMSLTETPEIGNTVVEQTGEIPSNYIKTIEYDGFTADPFFEDNCIQVSITTSAQGLENTSADSYRGVYWKIEKDHGLNIVEHNAQSFWNQVECTSECDGGGAEGECYACSPDGNTPQPPGQPTPWNPYYPPGYTPGGGTGGGTFNGPPTLGCGQTGNYSVTDSAGNNIPVDISVGGAGSDLGGGAVGGPTSNVDCSNSNTTVFGNWTDPDGSQQTATISVTHNCHDSAVNGGVPPGGGGSGGSAYYWRKECKYYKSIPLPGNACESVPSGQPRTLWWDRVIYGNTCVGNLYDLTNEQKEWPIISCDGARTGYYSLGGAGTVGTTCGNPYNGFFAEGATIRTDIGYGADSCCPPLP